MADRTGTWPSRTVATFPGWEMLWPADLLGICLAQELLALRLALEDGCGPGPGPPRELSFTKSSQAVRAVRDILVSACASQWEQLRGLGSGEDELQKLGSEGGCPSTMTHFPQIGHMGPQIWCPPRHEGGKVSGTRGRAVILPGTEAVPPGGRGNSSSSSMDLVEINALPARRLGVGEGHSTLHTHMRTWSHNGVCHQVAGAFGRREGEEGINPQVGRGTATG